MNENEFINYAYKLYRALLLNRPNFNSDEYRWRLGTNIVYKYASMVYHSAVIRKDEIPTLYGIKVELDYENPDNVKLYEDITNKI